jgi:hypothetical protein
MSEDINVTLAPERLTVVPGESASATVTVRNSGNVVEAYSVVLEGIDPKWGTLDVSSTNLFPGDEESFELTVRPPRTSSSKAGTYEVRVNVSSRRDPSVRTIATLPVNVEEFSRFEVSLRPAVVRARKGLYTLGITNSGNSPSSYSLNGQDGQQLCRFLFDDGVNFVEVQPGTTREVKVEVDPVRKPLVWRSQSHRFRVSVLPQGKEGAETQVVEAELECIPRVSRTGVLAGIGTLIVVVALLVSAYQFHWGGLGGTTYELQVTYKLNGGNVEKDLQEILSDYQPTAFFNVSTSRTVAYNVTVIPDQEGKDTERELAQRVISYPKVLFQQFLGDDLVVARLAVKFSVNVEACADKTTIPLLAEDLLEYIDWSVQPWYNGSDNSFLFWTVPLDTSEQDPTLEQYRTLVDHFTEYKRCITISYWFRVIGKGNVDTKQVTESSLEDFSIAKNYEVKVSGEDSYLTGRIKVEFTVNSRKEKEQFIGNVWNKLEEDKMKDIIWDRNATRVTPEIKLQ